MVTVATAGTDSRDSTPRNRLNGPVAHTAFVVQNVPMRLRRSSILLALLIAAACDRNKGTVSEAELSQPRSAAAKNAVVLIDSPATAAAAEPFLFAARDGSLIMSWLEHEASSKNAALKLARFSNNRWTEPVTVVERDDLFVNWADFPSVVEARDGTLFAHWLQKSGSATYAYDVMLARSKDGGKTWSIPAKLHDDKTKTEHGFVSLVPHPYEAAVAAVWLDGRNMSERAGHGDHGDMSVRYAIVSSDGHIEPSAELDGRTCECCTTTMAWTEEGPIVAYRDRSPDEIRDIAIVRKTQKGWTAPQTLHQDGWKIAGCPVNGPQIDARGHHVAVAWFTAAGDKAHVLAAFSDNAGATFSAPTRIDAGAPTGRVDLVLLDDGGAFITWIDGAGNDAAIVARRVAFDGKMGPVVTVARSSTARSAGFPRAALVGHNAVYVAWTEFTPAKRVRLARVAF